MSIFIGRRALALSDGHDHHCETDVAPTGLPARLKAARKAKGLGMNALNRLAELAGGTVSSIEAGRRPLVSLVSIQKLGKALDVSIEWLAEGRHSGHDPAMSQPVASFLLALDRRKLREAIERDPGRWKLSTIATAATLTVPSGPDGVPTVGWPKVLDEIENGTFAPVVRRPTAKRAR